MDAGALLQVAFSDLHNALIEDAGSLSPNELFWQPAAGVNHAGFLLWHVVRDEDTVISQSVLDERELWAAHGWATAFQMDESEQGTGMEVERMASQRYALSDLLDYAGEVWARTDTALSGLGAHRLHERITWNHEWQLANLLTTGCLAHGWVHLGEMRQLRGLRGWKYRE